MANDEQVENLDFNVLVARCAGSEDRNVQEEYLAKVVMELMIEYFGEGTRFSDEKVIQVIKKEGEVDAKVSWQIKDRIFPLYIAVAKALLDDMNYDLFDMRINAIKFLRQKEPRTFKVDRKERV